MRKKLLSILVLLCLTVTSACASPLTDANTATKDIFLSPGVWNLDNAIYAAYVWDSNGNAWFPFTELPGTNYYLAQVPDNYTGLVLVRLRPNSADGYMPDNNGLNWANEWNQTADIDFSAVADMTTFAITGWDDGGGKGYSAFSQMNPNSAKVSLKKVVAIAKIFDDIDTSNAEALLLNPDASPANVIAELQDLGKATKDKTKEVMDEAKQFFATFDGDAATNLDAYFTAAETALDGTDFDAISNSLLALASNALPYAQSAMGKVNDYLQKMGSETINSDLEAIQSIIQSIILSPSDIKSDLPNLIAAIKQLKGDMTGAAATYMNTVKTLIDDAEAAGKDVSEVKAAYTTIKTKAAAYLLNSATLVEMGKALYDLIKEVEEYKEAQEVPTGISGFTAEKQNSATIYNLNGQRVEKAQKGLYIINGKKVMVK
ncbi:MAG: hypothetical protein IKI06_00835 [Prevotella sp.]|nr:hypothetical protein [Prevotella sp.]